MNEMSTPTHRRLVHALDVVKTSKGGSDRRLCREIGVGLTALDRWRVGRARIGERSLWQVRTFLVKHVAAGACNGART